MPSQKHTTKSRLRAGLRDMPPRDYIRYPLPKARPVPTDWLGHDEKTFLGRLGLERWPLTDDERQAINQAIELVAEIMIFGPLRQEMSNAIKAGRLRQWLEELGATDPDTGGTQANG